MILFRNSRDESLVQCILFAMLVVLTPFIVVTRFSQRLAYFVSHLSFKLFEHSVPIILVVAIAAIIAFLVWQRRKITGRKIVAVVVILILISIAHRTNDIYMGLSFFDLQVNWHYFAYCAYAFFFFRAFNARGMPVKRRILITYFSALMMSLFDETFQFFMSDRVFDISDIAKDGLGVYLGLLLLLFVTETYGTIQLKPKDIHQKRPLDYFRQPSSSIVTLGVLTMSFILISPLLTEYEYFLTGVLMSLGLFLLIMLIISFFRFKIFRLTFICFCVLIAILLSVSVVRNWSRNLSCGRSALLIYKGIPIPYFDFLIYPDGYCHLIDKKKYFRTTDKDYMLRQRPNIIVVGAGRDGSGGKGFDQGLGTHFVYNRYTLKGTQVIILPTPDAVRKFNQLKDLHKSVFLVMHNN